MAVSPVEVFVAAAADRWHDTQALRGHDAVRLVDTPRHATVLLVAGTILEAHRESLDRVHDQLPHPRTVVTWEETDPAHDAVDAVARTIVQRGEMLLADRRTSSPTRLADEERHEWRGVGPFGQGGEGMMGGTPYGRPMAMTADDRDGLALDQLQIRLGPFAGQLPGGLVAAVKLQGEVIQAIEFDGGAEAALTSVDRDMTVPRRLQWLSHALHVQGLDPFAARAGRLACRSAHSGGDANLENDFRSLRRRLRWTGLRLALQGVGQHGTADCWARWTNQLDAISAGFGEAASTAAASPDIAAITATELATIVAGMTLTDAVSTILSFDIDVPATANATVEP